MQSVLSTLLSFRSLVSRSSFSAVVIGVGLCSAFAHAADITSPVLENAKSVAKSQQEMQKYDELIEHTDVTITMVPIPGGAFQMGSDSEKAQPDEKPVHAVTVSPFWMGETEITWDQYDVWMADLDVSSRKVRGFALTKRDELADVFQKSQPTPPYVDMTFGMGKRGFPAISMTQHAARTYCKWLSAKTGRYYRLPTEAEWEYACRAGSTTDYFFGDDPAMLDEYAWYEDNYNEGYEKVRQKKPNPWGLYDIHGNVAEWVLDQYTEDGYQVDDPSKPVVDPLNIPKTLYPRVVRGGGWNQPAEKLRSSAREGSNEEWIAQDPQNPVSIWYLTDATHVGLRVVRPLAEPTDEEKLKHWEHSEPIMKERPIPLPLDR